MISGYARVSTDGQSLDTQVRQLRAAGAQKVFRETASGAQTDRPQLRRALSQLTEGDVLSVTRLDRLARSIRDRTGKGRERAKARGVKMGRRPKLTDHQKREALKRRDAGEPMREIARTY